MYNSCMSITHWRRVAVPAGLALAALLLFAAGCPNGDGGKGAAGKPPGEVPPAGSPQETTADLEYARGLELSLFAGTPLEKFLPDSFACSRDGNFIFFHGQNSESGDYFIVNYSPGADKLVEGPVTYPDKELFVPYVAADPKGKEALASSQWQPEPKHVRDVVWRIGPEVVGVKSGVPYDRAAGMPASDAPYDTWMNLSPFYAWDGASVLVPLNQLGICVTDVRSGASRYSTYPALPFQVSGRAFGPVPDEDGVRRIWASFWQKGRTEDACEVWLLDLDSLKWEKVFSLKWIAYQVGIRSVYDEPWLVAGSRAPTEEAGTGKPLPTDVVSAKRVPRLALVVPRSQTEQLLELHGAPVWNVAMEPHGQYVAYMDRQRRGIVRYEPATGKLDLDSRFFSGDDRGSLFCGEGGQHVYYWFRGIFVEAKWDKHENFPGT